MWSRVYESNFEHSYIVLSQRKKTFFLCSSCLTSVSYPVNKVKDVENMPPSLFGILQRQPTFTPCLSLWGNKINESSWCNAKSWSRQKRLISTFALRISKSQKPIKVFRLDITNDGIICVALALGWLVLVRDKRCPYPLSSCWLTTLSWIRTALLVSLPFSFVLTLDACKVSPD